METKGTKLTLEIDGIKTTWEHPSRDLSVTDILEGMCGLMVGHIFHPASVYRSMYEISTEMLPTLGESLDDSPNDSEEL